MQFLADIGNYLSDDIHPEWYKYAIDCSGIMQPADDRPVVSTVEIINDITECIKNNKYPTYYKYASCSGVITPDMLELVGRPEIPEIITLDKKEVYHIPIIYDHETKTSKDEVSFTNQVSKKTTSLPYLLDKVEYSVYSNNSKKDKIYNMIKRVYRYNDDKYAHACKYILSKFSHDSYTDPIVGLNELLNEKNIYNAIEFDYNPILRLMHVKNIDNILTIDDMYKIFSLLY